MTVHSNDLSRASQEQWLKLYYFARTAFSAVWVAAAFTAGQHSWVIAAVLLVAYPAWDALANFVDASRSGGLGQNRTQTINVVVSVATTLAVVLALEMSMNWVLGVFGVWAILSGLLQLGTAVRRCAVGDDPERRAISAGRHVFHRAGADADAAIHHQRGRLCRSRRLLLPSFGGVAEREPIAAEGCIGPPC